MSDLPQYNAASTIEALRTERLLALHEGYALVRHHLTNDTNTAQRTVSDETIQRWLTLDDEEMVRDFMRFYANP